MANQVTLEMATETLSELIDDICSTKQRVLITKQGVAVAAMMGVEDLASMEETIDVLSDRELLADIRQALRSPDRYDIEDVKSRLRNRES